MRQFLMYGIVGAGGTVCHYAVLFALVELFNVLAVTASSVGLVFGALVNHELNRHFVFSATNRSRYDSLSRFFAVACLGFLLNFGIMQLMIEWLGIYYLVGQVVATLAVFLVTFVFNKAWTFGS